MSENGDRPIHLSETVTASVLQSVNLGASLRARLAAVAAANQRDVTAEARHVIREHVTRYEREGQHGHPHRT